MQLIYFSWIRETIGRSDERLDLPAHISSVEELLTWLPTQGSEYAAALSNVESIKIAVNQEFAQASTKIAPGDEVALFPPVTGG